MRSFSDYNPAVIVIYFFTVTGIAMFCNYPLLIAVTLVSGVLNFFLNYKRERGASHLFFFLLFVVLALANPVISHNGVTVLFVLNDNPITLESLLYGVNSAAMIVGVLYWFASFTKIMTSDKLLYVTGVLSPKLSLVLSMALRFVPLFREQSRKVKDTQRAMGLFKEDNMLDDIRGNMRIFSIIITWALENGIITADSMAARGYGVARRTSFSNYRVRRADVLFLLTNLLLFGICAYAVGNSSLAYTFYPSMDNIQPDITGIIGILSYGLMALLPLMMEMEASVKWNYLKSKI